MLILTMKCRDEDPPNGHFPQMLLIHPLHCSSSQGEGWVRENGGRGRISKKGTEEDQLAK
jgi:hypothetical protein